MTKSALLKAFTLLYVLFLVTTVQASDETKQPDVQPAVATYVSEHNCVSHVSQCCLPYTGGGGRVVSVNKFDLVAPYVGLALAIIAPGMIIGTVRHVKSRKAKR